MQYQNDYLQQQPQQPVQPQAGGYQPPAPTQPQGYTQPPQTEQPAPQPSTNSATFTADTKVLEYIQMVHPEMASAMVNLAIKKFVETDDFWNYFVKDEFQGVAQKEQLLKESKSDKEEPKQEQTVAPAMDFTGW
jgi:hypothetical protein